jgi:hypothetical protein
MGNGGFLVANQENLPLSQSDDRNLHLLLCVSQFPCPDLLLLLLTHISAGG